MNRRQANIAERLDRLVEYGVLRQWGRYNGKWQVEGGRGAIFTDRAYTTSQVEDFLIGALSGYFVGKEH